MEIAQLQKGLVLMAGGRELVEEGAGFGVPIVRYSDRHFFCMTGEANLHQVNEKGVVLQKIFYLDAVSKKQFRGAKISDALYSLIHKTFANAYLGRQSLRPVFDGIMQLRTALGVKTRFMKVRQRGKITVTYRRFSDKINVHVDLSALDKENCQEVLILNEQGATHFRRYFDTEGTVLFGRQIEAWKKVTAKQASFSDLNTGLTFTVQNIDGFCLFRGREQVKDRFSWAGLAYSLNPKIVSFNYDIRLQQTPFSSSKMEGLDQS